ncbi:MAG: hypothetical protein VW338_03485 [Rhodospirillaceae bacterium]
MNPLLVTLGNLLDDARVKAVLPLGDLANGFNAIMQLDAELRELEEFRRANEDTQHEAKHETTGVN